MARDTKMFLLEMFLLEILLFEAAEWMRQDPSLRSDDLDQKLILLDYRLARVGPGVGRWVLLHGLQPIAHSSANNDYEAIRRLVKFVGCAVRTR